MIRLLTLALVAAMTGSVSAQKQQTLHSGYPIDPVPFTSVKVTDSFWGQRLKASREVTIPLAFSKCEETGRYENFVKATHLTDDTGENYNGGKDNRMQKAEREIRDKTSGGKEQESLTRRK